MKNKRPSIDGFVPRRTGSQLGELHDRHTQSKLASLESEDRTLRSDDESLQAPVGQPRASKGLGRSDIDESLREIDQLSGKTPKLSRRKRRQIDKQQRPRSNARRIIKWFFILLLVATIGVVGYLGYKFISAGGNILRGNIFDIVQNQPLKKDANGRSNFVIFGTAEDDDGGAHGGANLTDSILVLSVDQAKKDAYMISLPRDLWVTYAETCTVGNQGKLNAAYFCASDDGTNEATGAVALQLQAGAILGLDIQYYIHLNFTAVIEAVDAVGGVEVKIESEDPRGILDRNFDWKCQFTCFYVNYKNNEVVTLDGERALALARARNAQGGYGLPGGNFDREKNQQKIIKALREKALSAGTLTNLGAVTGLINTLGKNLRTNVETKEIRTLMSLATDIQTDSIVSLSLIDEGTPLVTTGSFNEQSIVRPVLGISNFSAIQAFIKRSLTSDPVSREAAKVEVLNGSSTPGVAQIEADILADLGMVAASVANAPKATYERVEIYQITNDKPATATKLASLYSVTIKSTSPPVVALNGTDFIVIIGSAQ